MSPPTFTPAPIHRASLTAIFSRGEFPFIKYAIAHLAGVSDPGGVAVAGTLPPGRITIVPGMVEDRRAVLFFLEERAPERGQQLGGAGRELSDQALAREAVGAMPTSIAQERKSYRTRIANSIARWLQLRAELYPKGTTALHAAAMDLVIGAWEDETDGGALEPVSKRPIPSSGEGGGQ